MTLDPGEHGRFEMMVGYRTGDMWAPRLSMGEALRVEAEHFVDCIRRGRRPLTDGYAGLRTVHILDAATRSLEERGRPIELQWDNHIANPLPRPQGSIPQHQASA